MKYKVVHRDTLCSGSLYVDSDPSQATARHRASSYSRGLTTAMANRPVHEGTAEWVVVEDHGVERPTPFTETKPALSSVPPSAVLGVLRVFGFGNNVKYSPGDWLPGQPNERPWTAHADAAVRHLLQHLSGEVFDPESKLPHLDHAIARLIMARETDARTRGK